MDVKDIAALIVDRLESCRADIQDQWNNPQGTHTRHFVIDGLLPEEIALEIYGAYPRNADGFLDQQSFREKKKTLANLADRPQILRDVTYAMQSQKVVGKVAELVGVESLIPDPSLYAGGLSMMFKDNFLNPHIDNSHDGGRGLYRRLNLLYYVTPGWVLENGGNFELWDTKVKKQKTIVSAFNRLVVMDTNRDSWHSVSKVAVDTPRCCVSNYYFSKASPGNDDYFHVTSFSGRPEEPGKRLLGVVDNHVRNTLSKVLQIRRGKALEEREPD
ncbi:MULTISPECIES: 2OG-Fe(II) oxygenase [unclassified Pseudomonas]|uniref:2OG-Fe(II) oxygenase n=1 Tax=unclassified Pseudomonas TaxID=196821 RepID=UPI00128B6A5F|nr:MULTISPECIES: 2OG-Fe(II) oxygenase [unclassified Pseudomonas]MPQ70213.1 2OG-Fe(II) oxygenase [Pseudomonas sp. MWU12-2323]